MKVTYTITLPEGENLAKVIIHTDGAGCSTYYRRAPYDWSDMMGGPLRPALVGAVELMFTEAQARA